MFASPMSDVSELPITPIPGDVMPSSGFQVHLAHSAVKSFCKLFRSLGCPNKPQVQEEWGKTQLTTSGHLIRLIYQ